MKKYTNAKYAIRLAGIICLISIFIPANASAATVYLESSRSTVSVGDTVIVSARINAEGVTINTVEGNIALKMSTTKAPNVTVQEFTLANSSFGLWPRTPSLSNDAQTISFVGGVPGGFNIEGATLFKIVLLAKEPGTVTLTPENMFVYANDGKGTRQTPATKSLVINVVAKKTSVPTNDEWGSIVSTDKTPPGDFLIVLGQDPSMFDGKKFAFFSALDNQSGISYYQVSENKAAPVKSGSVYTLINQTGNVTLDVTAYDKAGNSKTATYSSLATGYSTTNSTLIVIVIIAIIVIIVAVALYRKSRKIVNNVPPVS